ncbi:MAG: type II secretion system protein [Rickettsiales bacterium]
MIKNAFTIVELSIALIIISLLATAVLAGSSLIENAKINKMISDLTAIEKSYQTFNVTYNAIPGDFANAYSIWSGNCATTAAICNGNGDGKIQSYYAGVSSSMNDDEARKAWRHMELAGVTTFVIYGPTFPSAWNNFYGTDTDIPRGPMSKSGYLLLYGNDQLRTQNEAEPVGGIYSPTTDNIIYLGSPVAGYLVANSALKPIQAMNIDSKVDDGLISTGNGASTGIFRAFDGLDVASAGNCATGDTYNLLFTATGSCVVGMAIH